MPRYRYKTVSASGTVIEGEMEAVDRQAVIDGLHRQGGTPIRADPIADSSGLRFLPEALTRKHGLGPQALALTTRELATLLRAGLPLDRALSILVEIAKDRSAQALLEDVLKSIRGGSTLANALETHRASLPVYYIGLVRAGEAGGALDGVLWRLSDALEHGVALRETIRSAMYYPAFVLLMSVATLVVMFTMVIPEFRPLFEDNGSRIPSSMAAMIAVSDLLREDWWAILLALLAVLLFARIYAGAPQVKQRRDRWILKLPMIGELVTKIEVARFARTLGVLLAHGVMVLSALSITADAVANREIASAIRGLSSKLGGGEGLAVPLIETGLFPRLAVQLIRVGEESGQLEPMLLRVAEIYDGEVKQTLQRILALLVPVMTICIGILVAGIIGTMLTAILSTYDITM
jgi:general secretion pathway protein F